ncbi:MAG: T9SS type A sorting domain-containing protein [Candidatus Cloacimonetes bacterium]|nr:T9SS type A sorting domain-containing protein [Candidatus Cloacimonadota bacterium]
MNKKVLFICLLVWLTLGLQAQLSWPEPLTLADNNNISFLGQMVRTTQGNTVLIYSQYDGEGTHTYMQAYTQDTQTMWDNPIELSSILSLSYIFLTNDSILNVFTPKYNGYNYNLVLNRYTLNGERVGVLDRPVMGNYVNRVEIYSDFQGGMHVFGKNYNTRNYQHINAEGIPQHPITDESVFSWLPSETHFPIKYVCGDGSLLMSYTSGNNGGIFRMDSSLNVLFSHSFTTADSEGINTSLVKRSDDGFYLMRAKGSVVRLYSYNSNGELLWPEPVIINQYTYCEAACDSQDRLITCYLSSHYIYSQVYDTQGNSIFDGPGIHIHTFPSNTTFESPVISIMPNGANGFYLIRRYTDTVWDEDFLQYIDLQTANSMWIHSLGDLETNMDSTYYATIEDGVFKFWNNFRTGNRSGITYNGINEAGLPEYASPGAFLESGFFGEVDMIRIRPIGPDKAIAVWAEVEPNYPNPKTPKYNLIHPGGTWDFEDGQALISTPRDILYLDCFSTDDDCALVVWQVNSSNVYAQKIDRFGLTLWPQPKNLFTGLPSAVRASYYENSLYLSYMHPSGTNIVMQRFVEGEPQWGPDGVMVAGTANGNPVLIDLIDRTVIWGVVANEDTYSMFYFNRVNQNGQSLEGFSINGLPITEAQAGDPLLRVHRVIPGDGRLWFELSMGHSEYITNGHSNGYWDIVFTPVVQSVSYDGDILFPNGGISGSYSVGSMADETGYFKCTACSKHLRITKYGLDGNIVWESNPLSEVNWLLDFVFNYGVSLQKVSDTEILAHAVTYTGNSYKYTYILFSPEGQFTYPADMYIQSCPNTGSIGSVTHTRMGTYLLMMNTNRSYAGIQFRASGAELSPDEDVPVLKLISAYPNPFRQELILDFAIERSDNARLEIFNIRGQRVLQKDYNELLQGKNKFVWNGRDELNRECASGIYFIRLMDGKHRDTLRTVRLK